MATNFEFYKTKLLSSISESDFCIKRDGTIDICSETSCNECALYEFSKNGPCNVEAVLKWANAKHIEQPKLTKRERAFCEAVQTGWIARDVIGGIYWYANKPKKGNSEWISKDIKYTNISVFKLFNFINWEDEKSWSVADLMKLEVEEECSTLET